MVTGADVGTFLDPALFCIGYLLVTAGLMLSQAHRDEDVLLHVRIGLLFNLLRKMSALVVLVGLIQGFWIVGAWWLLRFPIIVGLSGISVHILRKSGHRVAAAMTLMSLGLSLLLWAQGPLLR